MPEAELNATKYSAPMADNFSFVFKDHPCDSPIPLDVLDTQNNTLTHTPLEETGSVTFDFHLSNAEKTEIFQRIAEMDFFRFPKEFIIPEDYLSITETPISSYELAVTNGEDTNSVYWSTGGLVDSEYEKANQLWSLFKFIASIIHNHPEYKELPEPKEFCA
jgi:hypothetical protein